MFVIRGMGYAIFQFSNLFKKEKPIRIDAQDIDSTALSEPLSKSLNYLDLAVNPTSFLKQNSSSSLLKLGSILDLPLNKLVEAQKRAETNGEFQRGNMPSIFAKSSEQPVPVEEISGVVQSP
jgi:hypothetical protein